ncbi:MAG: hypothetical protein QGF00_22910 [Planctomycetota bacterium]|jgi:hypothetical protein|nr:hypothetical protein [Planctomycetota bacterium]MDP7252480.1 hypothetical protein [Planctomycetota bacterium]
MSAENRPQSDAGNSPAEHLELLEQYGAMNAAAQAIPAPSVSTEEWGRVWERIRDGMRDNDLEEQSDESWNALEQSAQNSTVPEVTEEEWSDRWSSILHSIRQSADEEPVEVSPEMIGAYLDGELAPEQAELVDAALAPSDELDSIAQSESVPPVADEEWERQWQNIARAIEPSIKSTSMEARLNAYHDGELGAEGRAEVEAWLEENPAGRETLRQFERLDALARLDEVPSVSEEDWAGRPSVMAEESQPESEVHRPAWVTVGLWAAGIAAGLAAIIWSASMFRPEPQTLAWQTRNESSAEEIDATSGDAFVYYSEEADLTIIWQTSD